MFYGDILWDPSFMYCFFLYFLVSKLKFFLSLFSNLFLLTNFSNRKISPIWTFFFGTRKVNFSCGSEMHCYSVLLPYISIFALWCEDATLLQRFRHSLNSTACYPVKIVILGKDLKYIQFPFKELERRDLVLFWSPWSVPR